MSLNPHPLTWLRSVSVLLAALSAAAPAGAVAAAAPARAFVPRAWTIERGLPHNTVNRVLQDDRGYLWVATAAGLARFDGRGFTEFPLPAAKLPVRGNVRDLIQAAEGRLLLLPSSGGVWQLSDGRLSPHPMNDDLAGESLLDLYAEPGGAVWVSTLPARLMRWERGVLQSFGAEAGIVRRVNRISFATDRHGRTWVAAGEFLGSYRDGGLRAAELGVANPGTAFLIAPARSGGLWLATSDQLLKSDGERFTTVFQGPGWPAKRSGIECLFEDRQGRLWIGSRRHGLFCFAEGQLAPVEISARMVSGVIEDRDGNLWAATSTDGLVRLRPQTFTRLDSEAGLAETLSSSVCEDARGVIWCANRSGGLVRFLNGRAEPLRTGTRLDRYATRVAPDRQGDVWAAADTALFRFPAADPEKLTPAMPSLAGVKILYGSRGGDMWVASAEGLGYFRGGEYHAVIADRSEMRARIDAVAEDSEGTIWIAAMQHEGAQAEVHVWCYEGGQLRERITPDAWPGGHILSLRIDGRDRAWFGTSAGLIVWEDGRFTRLGTEHGLPDEIISEQLIDLDGRVWFGSRRGFFHVPETEMLGVLAQPSGRVLPTVFGPDDGLGGAAALGVGQPREWRGRDGRLWFTSHRGIIGFDPRALPPGGAPPAVYLETISCDGRVRTLDAGPIEVEPDVRRITFRFAVLNLSAPEQIHVRHRLEGYDPDWLDAQDDRSVTYSRLPPGEYRLRIIAANHAGVWNEQGATLRLVVRAPWWRTPWFIATALLALGGSIAWTARTWSVRKMRRQLDELARQHALQQERARIARNLHDELGGSLTQIGLLAERVKRRSTTELKDPLGQLAWRTRSLAGDLESIVWAISPQNNSWDRLASFIARFAQRFFRDTAIRCTVTGVESIPARPLGPETQHEVLAVLKETLNNVLKHSQAQAVAIAVGWTDDVFELRIFDDGVGFDPSAQEHAERNGLNNIRTRGAALGGDVIISSQPGSGSTVVLRVPVTRDSQTSMTQRSPNL